MQRPTQEEMQESFDELTKLPGDCPPAMRQKISFLRQYINEKQGTVTNADIWHWLK